MFYRDERLALFIDGANLYAAARALGFDIDYKLLRTEFMRRGKLLRAFYYTALLESEEYSPIRPLVDWLNYNGFAMVTKPAKEFTDSTGRRKVKGNMDIELAVDAMEMAPHVDHIVLFSGDGDFRPLVEIAAAPGRPRLGRLDHPLLAADDRRRAAPPVRQLHRARRAARGHRPAAARRAGAGRRRHRRRGRVTPPEAAARLPALPAARRLPRGERRPPPRLVQRRRPLLRRPGRPPARPRPRPRRRRRQPHRAAVHRRLRRRRSSTPRSTRFGLANGRFAADPADGLALADCLVSNAVRCVPPQNKPTPAEIATCRPFLAARIAALPRLRAVVCLGRIAHETLLRALGRRLAAHPFAHGARHDLGGARGLRQLPLLALQHQHRPADHGDVRGGLRGGPHASGECRTMKLPPHHGSAACTETRLPAGLDLLLVEDQMLIAMDAEAILADAGIGRVVTACSVADALEHIRASLDVAVLDVNLGAGTSIPIAEELARRGVPFVFTTGYSGGTEIR